jgi:hypothetical protein
MKGMVKQPDFYKFYLYFPKIHVAEIFQGFHDWKVTDYLKEETFSGGDIYEDYCKTLEKIELAIIAKKAIFLRKE